MKERHIQAKYNRNSTKWKARPDAGERKQQNESE